MRICLFEDPGVLNLEPLALMCPAFELFCGMTTLSHKQCRYFSPCEWARRRGPSWPTSIASVGPRCASTISPGGVQLIPRCSSTAAGFRPPGALEDLSSPRVGLVDDEVAYAAISADHLRYCSTNTIADCLEVWKQTLPHVNAAGHMIGYLWDLVALNPGQITQDFERDASGPGGSPHPAGLAVVGPSERLLIHRPLRIDPMVVIDTTGGPVVI